MRRMGPGSKKGPDDAPGATRAIEPRLSRCVTVASVSCDDTRRVSPAKFRSTRVAGSGEASDAVLLSYSPPPLSFVFIQSKD